MVPFFHIGLLKVATTWDPDGLPAAYPFGHRHHTGQGSGTVAQRSTMTTELEPKWPRRLVAPSVLQLRCTKTSHTAHTGILHFPRVCVRHSVGTLSPFLFAWQMLHPEYGQSSTGCVDMKSCKVQIQDNRSTKTERITSAKKREEVPCTTVGATE